MCTSENKVEQLSARIYEKWDELWNLVWPDLKVCDNAYGSPYPAFSDPIDTIREIIFNPIEWNFPELLEAVVNSEFTYSLGEYWDIVLPEALRDENQYKGYIEFSHGYVTPTRRNPVRLDHFCFAIKLAAVFYAEHVDKDFDPWPFFPGIDAFYIKYSDPKMLDIMDGDTAVT